MPRANSNPRRGNGKSIQWVLAHVNYEGAECLVWPFSTLPNGYGTFGYLGDMFYAHRYMCELVNGPPPSPDHEAAHSCGNGRFGCCHPKHLSWKTPSQNALDSRGHGTQARNPWGSKGKLTRRQVEEIWALKGRETQEVIAGKFGISQPTVRDIYLGRTHRGASLISMLRQLGERDLSSFKNYSSGLWSKRNLEAMIDDLVVDTNMDR